MTELASRVQWLEERRRGVGSTDAPAIMGASPWRTPWVVWAEKVGVLRAVVDDPTPRLRFGRDMEPVLNRWTEEDTGLHVVGEQAMLWHPGGRPAFSTLDGLLAETAGGAPVAVLETKTTGDPPWRDVPEQYRQQVTWQMIAGVDAAVVAALHLAFGRLEFRIYDLALDAALAADMVERCDRFWSDYVLAGTPPPPSPRRPKVEEAALGRLEANPAAGVVDLAAYRTELAVLDDLEVARDQVDAEILRVRNGLRIALGEATEGVVDGSLVVSWRPQNRRSWDLKRLEAEHPGLLESYAIDKEHRVLRVHGRKPA